MGEGIIAEWANGQPGYDERLYSSAGTLPEVLRQNGYNTMALEKWHLAGTEEYGAAGPFSNWPLGKGFNRWYGFHGALADQYSPELYVDNHPTPWCSSRPNTVRCCSIHCWRPSARPSPRA